MRQAPQPLLSVDEYLEGELTSEVRHEYVAGVAHAMADVGRRHNLIAGNLFACLRSAHRVGPCQLFMSALKVRVPTADAFYYPDIAVTCDPDDDQEYYLERPCLIADAGLRGLMAQYRRRPKAPGACGDRDAPALAERPVGARLRANPESPRRRRIGSRPRAPLQQAWLSSLSRAPRGHRRRLWQRCKVKT